MMTKIRRALQRSHRDQEGGISAEYIAVIVIIAAVIAAVWSLNLGQRVQTCGTDAANSLFSGDESNISDPGCEDGGGNAEVETPGSETEG